MNLLDYIKLVAFVLFALFIALNVNIIYYMFYAYPRMAKANRCAVPKYRNTWPLGLPLIARIMYKFSQHDLQETIRTFILRDDHTVGAMMGGVFGFMTDDPENVKTILATKFSDYSLGYRYGAFLPLLGKGIFTLSGEGWKHSRAMLRPQFDRNQITHLDSIKQHAEKLILRLDEGSVNGGLVDIQELFHKLTIDTATEFLFGDSTDTLDLVPKKFGTGKDSITGTEFALDFNYCQDILAYRVMATASYFMVDSLQFRRRAERCKKFITAFVTKSLEKPMEKDEVRDRFIFLDELTKETRDPEVMRDQAFNILLAGRDTTASLMSFMAAYLSVHKDSWKKLREAVLEDFGTDPSNITFESLKRCQYLTWVMNEALRLHPIVAYNFRTAVKDTILPRGGGPNGDQPVFVEANTVVAYSPYSMQRHQDYWGEDADEFKPERWADLKNVGWKYLPFNGGPRICLGQQFALTEMGVVWARLAQTYTDFSSTKTPEELFRPKLHQRITISVDGGVPSNWRR